LRKGTGLLLSSLLVVFVLSSCGVGPPASDTTMPSANEPSTTAATSSTTTIETSTAATESPTTVSESTTQATTTAPIESTTPLPTPTELVLLPPVENEPPNTTYAPAFSGQTRAPGTSTKTPYTVTILSKDLKSPWAVIALPDNRLLITEKAGTLRISTVDGQLSQPIGGFPKVDDRGQGGLLDVALAPDFQSSRMIYFTLAESTSQGSLTAVGRGRSPILITACISAAAWLLIKRVIFS